MYYCPGFILSIIHQFHYYLWFPLCIIHLLLYYPWFILSSIIHLFHYRPWFPLIHFPSYNTLTILDLFCPSSIYYLIILGLFYPLSIYSIIILDFLYPLFIYNPSFFLIYSIHYPSIPSLKRTKFLKKNHEFNLN